MPVILLDRLPLPSLRVYTAVSVLLLSASVYYAVQVTSDPNWKTNFTSPAPPSDTGAQNFFKAVENELNPAKNTSNDTRSIQHHFTEVVTFMVQEPHCIWTLINMAYCWLILMGRAVQRLVFGELRVSEQQHIKDKFWNFVFYKFIFVFGVINVQYMDEVILWCSWFSMLGFLHLLAQLCKDRFEYLSFSPTTPGWSHMRLIALLTSIFMLSGFMFLICVAVGFFGGLNTFAFMAAECVLLAIRTLHVILRYALHLYDMRQEGGAVGSVGPDTGRVWEKRGPVAYYTELIFELAALIIDFVHHLHMLLWSNIFLSMASLVICMQLRYLFHEIQRRIKKHRNYLWVLNHMEQNYPMASRDELAENSDNCAICWEKMETARKLPCTHLFHTSCLQSWLEQDTSCPTCRLGLSIQSPGSMETSRLDPLLNADLQNDGQAPTRRQPNHFFHFDGSRYVSWLPSFSVEVTHAQLLRSDPPPAQTSQLDAMARQVQQLFPHMPMSIIIDDLRITRSVELTIENVLDGRLVSPPLFRDPEISTPSNIVSSSSLALNNRNWDDIPEIESEEVTAAGSRFSKSSTERERILQLRKELLLQTARKKYIEKQRAAQEATSQS